MKVLKIKPVPVPKHYDHPEPPHQVLMKHEFTLGIIGLKKKLLLNLTLKNLFLQPQRVAEKQL